MSMRKEFRRLIHLEEARSVVLSHLPVVEQETVSLDCAQGLVLAEKVVSEIEVPSFNRASMDGYAVKADDVVGAREDRPVRLILAGSVPMGCLASVKIGPQEAAEISTGSMMPDGADAVVMIEHSEISGANRNGVLIRKPVYAGENVLSAGSDIMFGDVVLLPGKVLFAQQIGLLAALGRYHVKVRRLRVGIASTGNELAKPGIALSPGQIYDINSYSIAAAAQECGATPVRCGILPDDHDEMAEALQKISQDCSMTLVSGSTSAGVGDMVYQILDELGETIFHGVNLKPGKPTLFGTIAGKPVLGLPGYPTSALAVFGQLAAPAIRKALGLKEHGIRMKGALVKPIRTEGRHQLLAVGIYGNRVHSVDKGSGSITTLAQADGVVEIPSQVEYLQAGEEVDVQLFGELAKPDLVIAGENCPAVEQIVESLPLQVQFMPSGSRSAIIAVEDDIADIACVSSMDEQDIPECLAIVSGYTRELGLMSRDPSILNMERLDMTDIVNWPRNSEMSRIFQTVLKDAVIDPGAVRFAGTVRTHYAVAAAVASGRAQLGFGAKMAAKRAGLHFRKMAWDRIDFLVSKNYMEDEGKETFFSVLKSEDFRCNLPAGILMDENAGNVLKR